MAITNGRLRTLDPTTRTVSFAYKDYAHGDRLKTLTLAGVEFIRRLGLHLLPPRFTKIRHYGLLCNGHAQPLPRPAFAGGWGSRPTHAGSATPAQGRSTQRTLPAGTPGAWPCGTPSGYFSYDVRGPPEPLRPTSEVSRAPAHAIPHSRLFSRARCLPRILVWPRCHFPSEIRVGPLCDSQSPTLPKLSTFPLTSFTKYSSVR